MSSRILYLLTRTPLHIGAGASVGAIDQPIIRERHTGFPIVPGSSLKGVLRDACRNHATLVTKEEHLFGRQEDAGRLTFGEAKLLAFPVRSAKGAFAMITCPLSLERFQNARSGGPTVPEEPADMTCAAGDKVSISRQNETGIVLEEYRFNRTSAFPQDWETLLLGLLDDPVWQAAKGRFVLLSNGDFSHFVRNACEVSQHVGIDPKTGTARSGALFNLEAVPAEALFFASIRPLRDGDGPIADLCTLVGDSPVMQFGGDSTTGLGFCSVKLG